MAGAGRTPARGAIASGAVLKHKPAIIVAGNVGSLEAMSNTRGYSVTYA